MKRILYLLTMSVLLLVTACGKDDEDKAAFDLKDFYGEWKLTEWESTSANMDVYIDFNEDKSFDMYQKTESVRFVKYDGTYSITGFTLSGVYSDEVVWGSDYIISFDEDKLILTSTGEVMEKNVYSRTTIPDDVKQEADDNASSKSINEFRAL